MQLIFTIMLRVTYASLAGTTGWCVPTRPPFSSLFLQPRIIDLRSLNSNLLNSLRYRGVESDLRVSLVNNRLVCPYSATVLVALPSAPDHRPPRLESAR
ncbi:hypothetical protein TNCV_2574491 [Trichonephila clavipes]|nr:hypothetical protein TNCV_2574491 [Trichonephila clavipes]